MLGNNKMISAKGDWPSWTPGNDALCFLAGSWHSIFRRHIQNWTLKAESKWVIVLEMCLSHIFLKAKGKRGFLFGLNEAVNNTAVLLETVGKGMTWNEKGVMGCSGDRVRTVSVSCATRRERTERTESWIQRALPSPVHVHSPWMRNPHKQELGEI